LIAIGLWWVYFDFVSHQLPRSNIAMVSGWLYLHLPLTIGIAAVGAAVLNVVEHSGEILPVEVRWLLVGAIGMVLISIALLIYTIQLSPDHQRTHRIARRVMLISAVLIILLGTSGLGILALLITVQLLLLAPVFFAFRVWIEMLDEDRTTVNEPRIFS
jgi:low temperature requirement protein LtrA